MRTFPLATGLVVLALGLGACGHGSGGGTDAADPSASGAVSGSPQASDLPLAVPSGATSGDAGGGPAGSLSASPASTQPDLAGLVGAAGVVMHVTCTGTGSPTVVVVTDLATASDIWADAAKQLSTTTRVCTYDRPGLGSSPPRHSPQQVVDAGLNARELATLLSSAGQRGPYVVVGQGYGTLVARSFARLYRALTAGLALAGQSPERASGQVFWTEAGHRVDIAASLRAAGTAATSTLAPHVLVLDDTDPTTVGAALPALVQQAGG